MEIVAEEKQQDIKSEEMEKLHYVKTLELIPCNKQEKKRKVEYNQQPAKKQCNLWRPQYGSGAKGEPEKNNNEGGSERENKREEKRKNT